MNSSQTSFLSQEELAEIGFKSIGNNVLISNKASFYNASCITIGSNVRIDDFCILSGNITLGNYIHISAFSAMYGAGGIILKDFTGLSPRTTVFSASDDFSGEYLIGPMVLPEYTNVIYGMVVIEKHSQIGAGSIVLPGITIGEGVAVGAMSLVNKSLEAWGIYAGVPVKHIKNRNKRVLTLEMSFLNV